MVADCGTLWHIEGAKFCECRVLLPLFAPALTHWAYHDMGFSLDTLQRQGVFVKVFEVPVAKGPVRTYRLGTKYSFTNLGSAFVQACRDPNSAPHPKWESSI